MGKPMAKNLLKAGYKLVVNDLDKSAVDEVVKAGAEAGTSAKDVAEKSDIIITMLPNSPQVKTVVLGKNGVLEGARKGQVIIDMSSIAPLASQEICAEAEKKGLEMIDAPVSGGEQGAVAGTLSIMVGGKKSVFDKYTEILGIMGGSVVYCGNIGAGNTTKLANQVIVAVNIAALSEAFVLAQKSGVDPETVFQAIKGGLAGSTVMNNKAPMMLSRNYKPGFKIKLHIKDLANALDTGHAVGAPLPLTSYVMEILQTLKSEGKAENDHSDIIEYYEKIADVKVGKKS